MPLLRQLLREEDLSDVPACATVEQLLASSIDTQDLLSLRKQAAALCSAPLVAMSTMEQRQRSSFTDGNTQEQIANCSMKKCIDTALLIAKEDKQVLFLVRDPNKVVKYMAVAVSRPGAGMTIESATESLARVHFRQCRSISEVLCELEFVQQAWEEGARLQLVALGPLCDLFAGFQTTSGITATGAGLKRMVELAINRLRATTSIHVGVMNPEADQDVEAT